MKAALWGAGNPAPGKGETSSRGNTVSICGQTPPTPAQLGAPRTQWVNRQWLVMRKPHRHWCFSHAERCARFVNLHAAPWGFHIIPAL